MPTMTRIRHRCSVGVAALVIVIAIVEPAYSQPAAQAEALFNDGQKLMTAGKFAEACAAFDESQ